MARPVTTNLCSDIEGSAIYNRRNRFFAEVTWPDKFKRTAAFYTFEEALYFVIEMRKQPVELLMKSHWTEIIPYPRSENNMYG